mgnify:CR=1 FL=1
MSSQYIPECGDIVWVNFTPQAGREQAGHRPALVLSSQPYNKKTGLMVCCPMTTQIKGYPFEVVIARKTQSAVLADHVRSIDWQARNAKKKGKVTTAELLEVKEKIAALLGI